ncbi:MAG TPA: hypothetical protein VFV58_36620 [Blastocatellia bacterium]|jgi:hypothetical protein|nr:hypothetical protein [Blastocatellia bacterium]
MKWLEIKKAVEMADIKEDDEILEIHCELRDGDKALHPSKQGCFIRLSEHLSKEAQEKEIVGTAL